MNIKEPTFFIGYDSKEDIAYRVCKQSLLKRTSIPIKRPRLLTSDGRASRFHLGSH